MILIVAMILSIIVGTIASIFLVKWSFDYPHHRAFDYEDMDLKKE